MDASNGSVLSDKQIKDSMTKGNVVISPFKEENLGNSSYNVTLGMNYFRPRRRNWAHKPLLNGYFNPWLKADMQSYYRGPLSACEYDENSSTITSNGEVVAKYCPSPVNRGPHEWHLPPGTKYIPIDPHETILVHTHEFIGGRNNVATLFRARSDLARVGLSFDGGAGWGDIGFVGRLGISVTNNTPTHIPLIVGKRIGQIVFLQTGPTEKPYSGTQDSSDLFKICARWKPEDILPKLYMDLD